MAAHPRIARARRDARAKRARAVINTTVPALLKSNARARRGVNDAELISDPPLAKAPPQKPEKPVSTRSDALPRNGNTSPTDVIAAATKEADEGSSPGPNIAVRVTTTLAAAAALSSSRNSRVGILNMASPLRPGGGVLSGATSQEEWLCSRTTLYPSLRDEWYRLPEVGGVLTPDVLVFGRWDADAGELLDKTDQFFVTVVSAAMLRFPDVVEPEGAGSPSERRYAEEKDRELVLRKMRAVLRIFRSKGMDKIVLGAWGCGAYGNPVGEIARAWRRVLLGGKPRRKKGGGDAGAVSTGAEGWEGLEVVFAINDAAMAKEFAKFFGPEVTVEDGGASAELGDLELDTREDGTEDSQEDGESS